MQVCSRLRETRIVGDPKRGGEGLYTVVMRDCSFLLGQTSRLVSQSNIRGLAFGDCDGGVSLLTTYCMALMPHLRVPTLNNRRMRVQQWLYFFRVRTL